MGFYEKNKKRIKKTFAILTIAGGLYPFTQDSPREVLSNLHQFSDSILGIDHYIPGGCTIVMYEASDGNIYYFNTSRYLTKRELEEKVRMRKRIEKFDREIIRPVINKKYESIENGKLKGISALLKREND